VRRIAATGLGLLAAGLALAPRAVGDAVDSGALLARAFERSFEQPGVRRVELRILRGGRTVARRVFDAAHRREGALGRTLLRFTAPDYLRGHALLVLDAGRGRSDAWLYQPEEQRPRRVGTAQKADSFYGSDLTFEDLERPHWERWRIAPAGAAEEAGRSCRVVDATPPPDSQYARLRIWIDPLRAGVARIDFFRDAAGQPIKRLRVDLAAAPEERGFLRVGRLRMDQLGRDARTELVVTRMQIDPEVAARVFSAMRLEREGDELSEPSPRLGPEP
jgi:hypothetical protein